MDNTIRCFIAIELSEKIRNALRDIEEELKPNIPGIKWVRPENIHLTLKFLGHISANAVESVKTSLKEIAENTIPFAIRLSSPGVFPAPERPRIIWVGIDKGANESKALADAINDMAAKFGIEKENRPFHPHLTLGRIDFIKDKIALKNAIFSIKIPPAEMAVSKITLFQSILAREGAVYNILFETELTCP